MHGLPAWGLSLRLRRIYSAHKLAAAGPEPGLEDAAPSRPRRAPPPLTGPLRTPGLEAGGQIAGPNPEPSRRSAGHRPPSPRAEPRLASATPSGAQRLQLGPGAFLWLPGSPVDTAVGAQEAAKPRLQRRCLGAFARRLQIPRVRLSAFPGGVRGEPNHGLEGALFGLLEGPKTAEKPQGRDPGKAQGSKSLDLAGVLGRLGWRTRFRRTKTRGPVGPTDAAQARPQRVRGLWREQTFPPRRGGGAGQEASPPSRRSPPPASVQPPPSLRPPRSLPSPARRCSLRLSSLLSPPPPPSCLSPPLFSSFFLLSLLFVFSPPSRPGSLLSSSGPQGRR